MHGSWIRAGVCTVLDAARAEGLEPDFTKFFSGQEVDDEVCRRVEADEKVGEIEAGLDERGHDARLAFVGTKNRSRCHKQIFRKFMLK